MPTGANTRFLLAREQALTGLLRVGAIAGLLTLVLNITSLLQEGLVDMLLMSVAILSLVWILAVVRRINYLLRCGTIMIGVYAMSMIELFDFGYSPNVYMYLTAFSLFTMLFLTSNIKVGAGALALSVATLAFIGWQIHIRAFMPQFMVEESLSIPEIISICLIFAMIIGSTQAGIAALLHHLHTAWQQESDARALLQHERDLLEQRVIERTSELAHAHTQAMIASRSEAAQKEYLAALHQITLELLSCRDADVLLQVIIERAATILDAPYGELMLYKNNKLAVQAFTANQSFLAGDCVSRDQALLSWQAFDTRQPVILDDYSAWQGYRSIYSSIPVHAVADFPIMAGQHCLGVLAMGRSEPSQRFMPEDVQKGVTFARLAAIVLDNANLYATATHEIAERKQAEQVLQQYAEELQAHNAELDAFAHTVAHDLKNPLSSLLGYNQLLQLSYAAMTPAEVEEVLEMVNKGGRKIDIIITELLLLSSVRSRNDIPIQPLAMAEVVADVGQRLSASIATSQATIAAPYNWPAATGYAPWVEEVWVNYISNAIKYGGEPPDITLGADQPANGFVRFWVRDNGQGLSDAEQARLFTPFTRLQAGRAEGHGLGLSIVQRIITRLGGEVGVQSEPGRGSTFYFTLPMVE